MTVTFFLFIKNLTKFEPIKPDPPVTKTLIKPKPSRNILCFISTVKNFPCTDYTWLIHFFTNLKIFKS